MASLKSIAIACNSACDRIDAWARDNVAEGLTPLPRLNRDREILRKQQLETIADWLDRANGDNSELEAIRALARDGATKQALLDKILGTD